MPAARRAKGGRPVSTGRGARCGRQILVRLSAEEYARVLAAAERSGQPLAAWAREQTLRAVR